MGKILILFMALFLAFILPSNSSAVIKECSKAQAVSITLDDFIYVRIKQPDGTTIVYVYLSDGITLVNIYEEED